uniref:Class I SAM-dependent methyltransferase n=1 Tax=candidate division CPR3 bacterium TaxID=2268181 RepID=A0A7C4R5B1_UNCC3
MLVSCDICLSTKTYKLLTVNNKFNLYRCRFCRTVFVFPKPSRFDVSQYNKNRYSYSEEQSRAYLAKEQILRDRAKKCIDTILKYKENGYLLDIGCSYGFYLHEFKKKGFNVKGIDPAIKAIRYARKKLHLDVIHSDFYNYDFRGNRYDIVILIDVIEHFLNPQEAIIKIKKILKKDGVLVIQTPNYESLMSILTYNKWFWLLIPEHLHLFNPYSISYFLNINGFKLLKIKTWDDFDEFIKNILFVLKLKNKGKTKYLYFFLYYLLYIFYPFSLVWSIILLGSEIELYARREK